MMALSLLIRRRAPLSRHLSKAASVLGALHGKSGPLMSALGQERTLPPCLAMSALPRKRTWIGATGMSDGQ
jgi:hypothetical protein